MARRQYLHSNSLCVPPNELNSRMRKELVNVGMDPDKKRRMIVLLALLWLT